MLPFRFFLPITASDFASSLFSTKINFNFLASFVRWQNKRQKYSEELSLAVRSGLEPATPGVTGRYSNQLNYRTNCSDFSFFQRECKDIAFYDTYNILLITFSKNI